MARKLLSYWMEWRCLSAYGILANIGLEFGDCEWKVPVASSFNKNYSRGYREILDSQ